MCFSLKFTIFHLFKFELFQALIFIIPECFPIKLSLSFSFISIESKFISIILHDKTLFVISFLLLKKYLWVMETVQ